MRTLLLSLCLGLLASASLWSQEIRPPELTDEVVSQVVSRILRYEIKPGRRPRTVFLYGTSFMMRDGETTSVPMPIQTKWLPTIKNIDLKVYGKNDSPEVKGYYFDSIEKVNGRFEIPVGYGDLGIGGGEGKIWAFRVKRNKVRLWLVSNRGFGWANDAAGQ